MFRIVIWMFLICVTCLNAKVLDVDLSTQQVRLGETIMLVLRTSSPIKSQRVFMGNRSIKLFLDASDTSEYTYTAYFAVPRTLKRGDYVLKVDVKCKNKQRFYEHYSMRVDHPKDPKKGKVALTKQAKKIAARTKDYIKETRLLGKRFAKQTTKRLFEGQFVQPAQGRMSSGFGVLRTYNNGRTSSHAGVDISNKEGTHVVAPQYGRVILSKTLTIHGNTIMIDHGYGVVTVLCHLQKRLVKRGDYVESGQLIARMGKTGVASGVHLHWGMSVQNVRVDPRYWTVTQSALTYQ